MELNRVHFRVQLNNSASMNLIQFLAMKFDEFNRGRSSLQVKFREGRLKAVIVPETIDAARQLIL